MFSYFNYQSSPDVINVRASKTNLNELKSDTASKANSCEYTPHMLEKGRIFKKILQVPFSTASFSILVKTKKQFAPEKSSLTLIFSSFCSRKSCYSICIGGWDKTLKWNLAEKLFNLFERTTFLFRIIFSYNSTIKIAAIIVFLQIETRMLGSHSTA